MPYQNNSKLKRFSRSLRKEQTDAEKLLWSKLRNRQLAGFKFYRQFAINTYIIDFYCSNKKLAIELDGSQHMKQQNYDNQRTAFLHESNIKVIRFWDNEVLTNIEGVIEKIFIHLSEY